MADFSKASGNSMKDVELIAVVRPNKTAYKKDEAGKPTSEPLAHYVDVMVNNSGLKKGEIKEGKGRSSLTFTLSLFLIPTRTAKRRKVLITV